MRPLHRPPRIPAGRYPACRWKVFLADDAEPYEQHPNLEIVRGSKIARIAIEAAAANMEPGGWDDYAGTLDTGFQLEDLSHSALIVVNQEFAVQSHLLARAFLLCAAQRRDDATAIELGKAQWTGIAALTARRIRKPLAITGDDIEAVAKVFQMHPCFYPRTYVDFAVEITGMHSARISIGDCPALREGDVHSWFAPLAAEPHPALDAIAGAVNPRARCRPVADPGDAALAWEVVIDPTAEPQPEPEELQLARISSGAEFEFEQRRLLRH